jgi:hypothetical protein
MREVSSRKRAQRAGPSEHTSADLAFKLSLRLCPLVSAVATTAGPCDRFRRP